MGRRWCLGLSAEALCTIVQCRRRSPPNYEPRATSGPGPDPEGDSFLRFCCRARRTLRPPHLSAGIRSHGPSFFKNGHGPIALWTPAEPVSVPGGRVRVIVLTLCGSVVRCYFPPACLDTKLLAQEDEDERLALAAELAATSDCCLDPDFSRKLKSWGPPRVLASPDIQEFLAAVFDHMPVTTTLIENSFAHMRSYITRSMRPPHIRSVAHRYRLLHDMPFSRAT